MTGKLPIGYRAIWQDRGRLAVAKLATSINPNTVTADFPALLMRDGKKPEDDQFMEVHIYGSLSIYSVAEVSLRSHGSAIRRKALLEKLAKLGISLKSH